MYITTSVIVWAIVFYVLIFLIGGVSGALIAFRIVNNYIGKEMEKAKKRREARRKESAEKMFHELAKVEEPETCLDI